MIRTLRARGFSLLEVLLVVGLLAMLLTGVYQLFDSWLQRAVNRQAATDTLRLEQAASDYVYTNFDTLKVDNLNTWTEINIATLTGANFLPSGYTAMNAFRQPMRVFKRARQVARLHGSGMLSTIDVLTIAGTTPVSNERILDAAMAGGPQMGLYSQIVRPGTTFTGRIISPFQSWYIDASPMPLPGYTSTTTASAGYLAAFNLVTGENVDVNDNYLYRVSIDGHPELNRMQTDLHMNSNSIEDAGTAIADKMDVTGNAAFRGNTQGSASATAQAMSVDQALRIDSASESRLNMRFAAGTSAGCTLADDGTGQSNRTITGAGCTVEGGELQVISRNNNATMNVTGNARIDGNVITDIANATGGTTAQGVSTFQNATGTSMTVSKQAVAPITNVTGNSITATQLQTATADLWGTSGGNALTVKGPLVAAQVSPTGTHTVTMDDYEVYNSATLLGNLIVKDINATQALSIGTAEASIQNAGPPVNSYLDSVLNRYVLCTAKTSGALNGNTYCEPTGDTYIKWPQPVSAATNNYHQDCRIGQLAGNAGFGGAGSIDGYGCREEKSTNVANNAGPWTYIGYCNYTRTLVSGKAVHNASCTPFP